MIILASIFVLIAVAIHIFIWVLETFLWDKSKGMEVFGNTPEKARLTKEMAINQGLYNLMLAVVALAGVITLLTGAVSVAKALIFAGAGSMAVAGIFLLATSPDKRRPALIQCLPPLIGVLATLFV